MTKIRLPTTPIPKAEGRVQKLGEGTLAELAGLLIIRNDEAAIADRIASLLPRCDAVVVVDDGSLDDTAELARGAGGRVLQLPAPAGEGAALMAGVRFARELGYIAALLPGAEILCAEDVDALALAHRRAPEALILGVGPGQVLAGKEWDEVAAVAEGREPEPYPDYRPPRAGGLAGQVEQVFERLVETRFSYPWGGPRVLPLQSICRRDLRSAGDGIHMEMVALAIVAGIPSVEVELNSEPARRVVTGRRACAALLRRFVPLLVSKRIQERLGLGGGYAPPTQSPLVLLLSASLAAALVVLGLGCVAKVPAVGPSPSVCDGIAKRDWPGAGIAQEAWQEALAERTAPIRVDYEARLRDPGVAGERRLKLAFARAGQALRLRLIGPLGMAVADYVRADERWELTIPPLGVAEAGAVGEPLPRIRGREIPLTPDRLTSFFGPGPVGETARWQEGSCAVLEELDGDGVVVRSLGFDRALGRWVVARETLFDGNEPLLVANHADYRELASGGLWPHFSEFRDPRRGSVWALEAAGIRTGEVADSLFVLRGNAGPPPAASSD